MASGAHDKKAPICKLYPQVAFLGKHGLTLGRVAKNGLDFVPIWHEWHSKLTLEALVIGFEGVSIEPGIKPADFFARWVG